MANCAKMIYKTDPWLAPYKYDVDARKNKILKTLKEMTKGTGKLSPQINNHLYYGLHLEYGYWVFREWAPNATKIYLTGSFNGWKKEEQYALKPIGGGNWELVLPQELIHHGDLYKWYVEWPGGGGERLPAYTFRAVQDPETHIF